MLCDKVACDWPKTCHLGHLAMFDWLLNLTWIAISFDVCGLASLVFNLTWMAHHLICGISLGLKVACDWSKTCHLGYLTMFDWLLNLTWIATSYDVCGLASMVFNLTGMPHHLIRGIRLGLKLCAASREISYLNAEVSKSDLPFNLLSLEDLQTERGYLQRFEIMVNFRDQMKPYPLLEITNDERYSPASVLTLKVHPPVIGVFAFDRGLPDMSLHLEKWSTKEEIDVLDSKKVINTTTFVLHSSTHDKESTATYPKGSNKGLAT
ncbi:hypothetical protein BC332_17797 [Capsicum chinense]|nr:hypothetical protein BC332_17797 [Capsicum chinense]